MLPMNHKLSIWQVQSRTRAIEVAAREHLMILVHDFSSFELIDIIYMTVDVDHNREVVLLISVNKIPD